jgi:hypothetical protein
MKIMDGRLSDALATLAEDAERESYPSSDNITAVAIQIMSLQLKGKAIREEIDEQVEHASGDPVKSAIDVIENTFKLYEHELK